MQAAGEIFYHIHEENKHSEKWKPGNIISFKEAGNYFSLLREVEILRISDVVKAGKPYFISNQKLFYDARTTQDELWDLPKKELLYRADSQIEELLDKAEELQQVLLGYIRYHIETIFETVRSIKYPHLPSRKRGAWLCKKKDLARWWEVFTVEGEALKVFQVKAYGEVLKTDGSFIDVDLYSIEQTYKMAEKYWKGELNPNKDRRIIEYLFEGDLEIIKEIEIN